MFVLDASVTLRWCFEDESKEAASKVLRRLAHESAIVPALWVLEVGNALAIAMRRKRLDHSKAQEFLKLLRQLPIEEEAAVALDRLEAFVDLAGRFKLSVYDTAYLELALRRAIPLATADRALAIAAGQAGVDVLDGAQV